MTKPIKQANSIRCPLVVGQNAIFTLTNGKTAQSKISSINEVKYQTSDHSLRVSFETGNSIYENISIPIQSMPFYVDQTVSRGLSVNIQNMGSVFIDEIVAITEIDNVINLIVKDVNGTIYSCPFLKR